MPDSGFYNVAAENTGADPAFLDRGFKFTKGGLIC